MGWLRSNGGKFAWLAFFALACQFMLTFGHVHLGNAGAISTALPISADAAAGSAGAPSSPAQKTPAGLVRDFCAGCNNIGLANAIVLPTSPAAIPSISIIEGLQWPLAVIGFTSHDHFYFNARGPPRV
jgi:hypothetical protein